MKQRGLKPMKFGAFQIDEEGGIHRLDHPLPPEVTSAITAADPRLHDLSEEWSFE
jgi:hypothetical protein